MATKTVDPNNDERRFNPSVESTAPETFGYTRPPQSSDSLRYSDKTNVKDYGYLTSWGEIIKTGTKVTDDIIRTEAETQTRDELGAVRDQVAGLPSGIKDATNEMRKIHSAHQAGTMSESAYYANLAYKVKSVKSRFGPGYEEDIDRAASATVGFNPANALVRERFAAIKAGQAQAGRYQTYLNQNEGIIATVFGDDFWDKQGTGEAVPEHIVHKKVAAYKARTAALEQQNAIIDSRVKQNLLDKTTQEEAFRGAEYTMYRDTETAISRYTNGITEATLNKAITAAQADRNITSKEAEELQAQMQALRSAWGQHLESVLREDHGGWTYEQLLSPQQKIEMRKNLDEKLAFIENRLYSKDYGALSSKVLSEQMTFNDAYLFKKKHLVARKNAMMLSPQLLGPNFSLSFGNIKDMSEKARLLTTSNFYELTGGEAAGGPPPSIKGIYDRAIAEGNSPEEASQVTENVFNEALVKLTDPTVGDKAKLNYIEGLYGKSSAEFYGSVDDKNLAKHKALSMAVKPSVVAEVKAVSERTGKPEIYTNFLEFVKDTTATQLREDATNAQNVVVNPNGMTARWNSKTHAIEVNREDWDWKNYPYTTGQKESVAKINMSLQAMIPALKAQGLSDEEVDQELMRVATDSDRMGIDLNATKERNVLDTIWEVIKPKYDLGLKGKVEGDVEGLQKEGFISRTREALGTDKKSVFPKPMHAGVGDGTNVWDDIQKLIDNSGGRKEDTDALRAKISAERAKLAEQGNLKVVGGTDQSTVKAEVNQSFARTAEKASLTEEKLQSFKAKGHEYLVIDRQTGKAVDSAETLKSARTKVDNRDNKYGAVRYGHERVDNLLEGVRSQRAIGASEIKGGSFKSSGDKTTQLGGPKEVDIARQAWLSGEKRFEELDPVMQLKVLSSMDQEGQGQGNPIGEPTVGPQITAVKGIAEELMQANQLLQRNPENKNLKAYVKGLSKDLEEARKQIGGQQESTNPLR